MTVGLGSGSTATLWIRLLGEQVRDHGLSIRAVASSEDSERLGRSFGIPIVTLEECKREKIVATASNRFVIIADASKVVTQLGRHPLPVEVIPMAEPLVSRALQDLGFQVDLRINAAGSPYITDQGNRLFDCSGVMIDDPPRLAAILDGTVGLVEHGLFLNMAQLALIASPDGLIERES
jgi:ribose 5-phosphate isomerase A